MTEQEIQIMLGDLFDEVREIGGCASRYLRSLQFALNDIETVKIHLFLQIHKIASVKNAISNCVVRSPASRNAFEHGYNTFFDLQHESLQFIMSCADVYENIQDPFLKEAQAGELLQAAQSVALSEESLAQAPHAPRRHKDVPEPNHALPIMGVNLYQLFNQIAQNQLEAELQVMALEPDDEDENNPHNPQL